MPRAEWTRQNIWLRLMLSSPTGGGKTLAALTLAANLYGGELPIVAIDTEDERMRLYADLVPLADYRTLAGDYSPEAYIREIDQVERDHPGAILIVDSVTHEWSNTGGALEIADSKGGGNWKEATPRHNKFTGRLSALNMHLIVCVRSKMKYDYSTPDGGKMKVSRLGVGPEQRDNFPYGFDVEADIDHETHLATFTKARRLRALEHKTFNLVPDLDDLRAPNEVADILTGWLAEGEPMEPLPEPAPEAAVLELTELLRAEGIAADKIALGFDRARRESRGVLTAEYVERKTEEARKRASKREQEVTA